MRSLTVGGDVRGDENVYSIGYSHKLYTHKVVDKPQKMISEPKY